MRISMDNIKTIQELDEVCDGFERAGYEAHIERDRPDKKFWLVLEQVKVF